MKFEDLIERPLDEMTDKEIEDLIEKLSSDQLARLEVQMKKHKTKRSTTKRQVELQEELDKALLKGLEK